jgi:hypothetical protein
MKKDRSFKKTAPGRLGTNIAIGIMVEICLTWLRARWLRSRSPIAAGADLFTDACMANHRLQSFLDNFGLFTGTTRDS